MPGSRVCRLPLEVGSDEVDDLPHAVPSGGLRLRYRAIDHGRQRDGRVMAPEAGQDVLRHHPDQLATLGFELTSEDWLQAMEFHNAYAVDPIVYAATYTASTGASPMGQEKTLLDQRVYRTMKCIQQEILHRCSTISVYLI